MKIEKFQIKAHEFKHSIEVQRQCTDEVDDEGLPCEEHWDALLKTRAKVINAGGSERLQAKQIGMEIDKTFYIRARRDKEITDKDRILYKGDYYNIVYVNNVQDSDMYIEIKAKLVE